MSMTYSAKKQRGQVKFTPCKEVSCHFQAPLILRLTYTVVSLGCQKNLIKLDHA